MTTSFNKAHVVFWKQTLSWCKRMQLPAPIQPFHLLLLRIQTIFFCQRPHYSQREGFKCLTHTAVAPPRKKAESRTDNPGGSPDLKTLPQNAHKNLPVVRGWEKEQVSVLVQSIGLGQGKSCPICKGCSLESLTSEVLFSSRLLS